MNTASNTGKPFTIVVGVDYSELGELALEQAVQAGRAHAHVRLHVVHVIGGPASTPLVGTVVEADEVRVSERLREHIESVLARHREAQPDAPPPFERLSTHIRFYGAAESIAQLAEDVEADLVVVGTHGRRGVARVFLGSVAEGTVRLAPCPVLVVRPRGTAMDLPAPKIEPACPRCLETRRRTDGKEFWCEEHRTQHGRRHTYHFGAGGDAHQSGLLVRI
jgi:nucleotide-binding universal stress UspA family protein